MWGDTEHLLASLIDVVQFANYLTLKAHFKGKPRPPRPIRRPGETEVVDGTRFGGGRKYSKAEMRKILDNWGSGAADEFETQEVT